MAPETSQLSDLLSYSKFASVCGAVAMGEGLVTYPFDLVKTRQQATPLSSDVMHHSTLRYLQKVVHNDGVRALYRGFGWSVIGGLPSEVSFYLTYVVMKDGLLKTKWGAEHPSSVYLVAGAGADAISLLLWVPADVISQRLQMQGVVCAHPLQAPHALPQSGWQMARHTIRTEGVVGMWRGLGATIAVHSPSSAVWWLTYETGKEKLGAALGKDPGEESVLVQATAGAMAGGAAAAITTPLDVLKTRVQCAAEQAPLSKHLLDVVREAGGLSGLFRGFLPRLIASAPRSVISLLGYEMALAYAGHQP
ncbi:mitochondrial carrier domain-containing protein [Pavlovales sp. CCMP2436]|nr:mitochondrial carrier domain-containing protein [Pavlovales sp. CCMP2436]|mmetsp:Transcript_4909/g.12608  ORF Transcript_4909/g.12608 Transcript_4909/m.12608 type:complete len:307 (-) Transcript_4909:89-1009(-)